MDTIVTKDYTYTVTDSGGETQAAEAFISVSVTDTIEDPAESHNFTAVNGTTFTFRPAAIEVTNTFRVGPNTRTFTLFTTEPGHREGGADTLLDGAYHDPEEAKKWIQDSEAVLRFVRGFIESEAHKLRPLITASRFWGHDSEERLVEATTVTGIVPLVDKAEQALLSAPLVPKFIAEINSKSAEAPTD